MLEKHIYIHVAKSKCLKKRLKKDTFVIVTMTGKATHTHMHTHIHIHTQTHTHTHTHTHISHFLQSTGGCLLYTSPSPRDTW